MVNLRKYGESPYKVAVIHGGPGAAGEMAPVARELARQRGVLEPIQTATTLEGQVEELRAVLEDSAGLPAVLIGYSWGAWLSMIVAARYPALVRKLILVSSGPFEDRCAAGILATRLSRLSPTDRSGVQCLLQDLEASPAAAVPSALARLGDLISRADAYDPLPDEGEVVECRTEVYQGVWPAAAELRRRGELLGLVGQIYCPVVAIHGDYDPHPAEGVREPLARVVKDFRMVLLKSCGHTPWRERQARDRFYEVLRRELEA